MNDEPIYLLEAKCKQLLMQMQKLILISMARNMETCGEIHVSTNETQQPPQQQSETEI